jgi:ketosteroid isomerase-like protein
MSNSADELQELLAAAKREGTVIATGDIEGYLDLLADDAVFLPPKTPVKAGSELRVWLREFLQASSVEWLEYVHGASVISGNLAVHDYAYVWRVTPKSGAQPVVGRGKGLQVFSRQPGGPWKLLRNVWNANPAE